MSNSRAWPIYAILAILPYLWFGIAAVVMFFDPPAWLILSFGHFWVFAILYLLGLGLYIWNVWHNDRVQPDKRGLWTALIVFANMYVMPFYFWFYIRPKPTVTDSRSN